MATIIPSSRRTPASSTLRLVLLVLLPWLLLAPAGPAAAQQQEDPQARIDGWRLQLSEVQWAIERSFPASGAQPGEAKLKLQELRDEARALEQEIKGRLGPLREQFEQLGPRPEPGAPAEDERLAELREELGSRLSAVEANATQANLVAVRAGELLQEIAAWEQARFRQELLWRNPLPLSPDVWARAGSDAAAVTQRVLQAPLAWWAEQEAAGDDLWGALSLFLGVAALGLLLGWPARRRIARRFGRSAEEQEPTYARRLVAAIADGFANAVIPATIVGLALLPLSYYGLLEGLFGRLVYTGALVLAAFLMITGLARASLSPRLVAWRILPVAPARVRSLLNAIVAISAVLAISYVLVIPAEASGLTSPALESTFFAVQVTVMAGLLSWALSPAHWTSSVEESQSGPEEETGEPPPQEAQQQGHWLDGARAALRFVVILTPLPALAGYSNLASFVQSRLVLTAVVIAAALLLRLALRELLERLLHSDSRYLRALRGGRRARVSADAAGDGLTLFWLGLLLDLLLLVPVVYLLLLAYGVPFTTLQIWSAQLLSGVQVGGITLSLPSLLAALLVLVLGLLLTGALRRWLSARVLPNTRLDLGARNSIVAGAGYLGGGIAILLAISTLGVNFSNLALVAGALSLGIGFGLRTVVENFVAGLLLLIERPVKVGDWIVVGSTEGIVRHISVRSTEIETFDRASVIVPNSELIATAVTNWTHKNRLARLTVRVGAAYGSDTDAVIRRLVACAEDHPQVLRIPPPAAYLFGFGESALEFELRCFIGDTDLFLTVLSDLHLAVERGLREEGIAIPFPQRDVRLRQGSASPADGATEAGSPDPVSLTDQAGRFRSK